jgi:hypothetical protein
LMDLSLDGMQTMNQSFRFLLRELLGTSQLTSTKYFSCLILVQKGIVRNYNIDCIKT